MLEKSLSAITKMTTYANTCTGKLFKGLEWQNRNSIWRKKEKEEVLLPKKMNATTGKHPLDAKILC